MTHGNSIKALALFSDPISAEELLSVCEFPSRTVWTRGPGTYVHIGDKFGRMISLACPAVYVAEKATKQPLGYVLLYFETM